MRRLLLLSASLCLSSLAISAHANTITAGTYNLENAFAGGYSITGTVNINSAGNATGANLTFNDPNVANPSLPVFTQVSYTNVFNGLSQNFLTSSSNAGQISLYLDTNADATGAFDLCIGYTQCGTSIGTVAPSALQIYSSYNGVTHMSNPGLGVTNLSSGYVSSSASTVAVASTPEPSSIIMLGTGVIGIFAATRKRLFSQQDPAQALVSDRNT